MASTNHSANLGLCLWSADDRPKRADFVADNTVIDTVLGGHINNTILHVNGDEKTKIAEPFVIRGYSGTGESSYSLSVGFQPKLVLVFKKGEPPVSYSSGNIIINSAVAAYGAGGTKGLLITSSGITVSHSAASGGAAVNLNELDEQYTAVLFR